MTEFWTKLIALFPAVWCAWVCIGVPLFLLIVGFLMAISKPREQRHKHSWEYNSKKSGLVHLPNEKKHLKDPPSAAIGVGTKAMPDSWKAVFEDVYECDCGEEMRERHLDLY